MLSVRSRLESETVRIAARRSPMPLHFGPGPVFIHQSVAATRCWQLYALRSRFVLGLLLALPVVLYSLFDVIGGPAGIGSIRLLATLGESFDSAPIESSWRNGGEPTAWLRPWRCFRPLEP